jgi:hypothetical protein
LLRNDLVTLLLPEQALSLADLGRIDVTLRTNELPRITIQQYEDVGGTRVVIPGGKSETLIRIDSDGKRFFELRPMRIGDIEIEVSGQLGDNAWFLQRGKIRVGPSSRRPDRLFVGDPNLDRGKITLYLDGHLRDQYLRARAMFDDVSEAVVPEPQTLEFRVTSKDSIPPIAINPTSGRLEAIHVGHAIITTRFGGSATTTCVVVEPRFDPGVVTSDRSHCEELLQKAQDEMN